MNSDWLVDIAKQKSAEDDDPFARRAAREARKAAEEEEKRRQKEHREMEDSKKRAQERFKADQAMRQVRTRSALTTPFFTVGKAVSNESSSLTRFPLTGYVGSDPTRSPSRATAKAVEEAIIVPATSTPTDLEADQRDSEAGQWSDDPSATDDLWWRAKS